MQSENSSAAPSTPDTYRFQPRTRMPETSGIDSRPQSEMRSHANLSTDRATRFMMWATPRVSQGPHTNRNTTGSLDAKQTRQVGPVVVEAGPFRDTEDSRPYRTNSAQHQSIELAGQGMTKRATGVDIPIPGFNL